MPKMFIVDAIRMRIDHYVLRSLFRCAIMISVTTNIEIHATFDEE